MSQPGDQPMDTSSGVAVTISSELMIAVVIFLFVVVVFIFFLYLYAKHYMGSNPRSRARVIFAASDQIPLPSQGLDAELLKALPITVVRRADFKDGLECAVCLSELSEGEEARLLPKCNHGFHVECIDMWFHSHSTCPVCRTAVSSEPIGIPNSGAESLESSHLEAAETPNFPTNVLFWGNQDQVSFGVPQEGTSSSSGYPLGSSSSGKKPEGMLVIEIPRRMAEGFPSLISPLPTGRFPVEEMKSPMEEMKTPKSTRLSSLRRLLSQGKRVIGSSCSPREGDIEQGVIGASGDGSVLAPKTPTS